MDNNFSNSLVAMGDITKACAHLMKTKHYAKMGEEGLCAILAKAKSLNVDPVDALNGGLYAVQGKVEMTSAMMNQLIRQNGHSISKDAKSDDNCCILHGKRADNGDVWTESFSIKEAKTAGIYYEKGPWGKYPRDMLFARALSRLARQLFPDVIKGCYVQGEIVVDDRPVVEEVTIVTPVVQSAIDLLVPPESASEFITDAQVDFILDEIQGDNSLLAGIYKRAKIKDLKEIKIKWFPGLVAWIAEQKTKMAEEETLNAKEDEVLF